MLKIIVPASELYDPLSETFSYTKETALTLEHSLVSLSKWESKWKVPFLNKEHTQEMFDDYIRCMTLTQNVDQRVYRALNNDIRVRVREYMDDVMTASIVSGDTDNRRNPAKFITSDLIYCWMVTLRIPFECQKWHLNRLLMLIRIINVEQNSSNKMSKADSARQQQALNAARRAKRRKR